jgi:hypothetical protein
MEKKLALEEETPLDYFSQITQFIYDPQYARYLRRIAAQYDRDALPADPELMPFFIDQLIFNTYIDGQTPLDHFISYFSDVMTQTQKNVYLGFKRYLFDCYQVLEHIPPDGVLLQDVLDHSEVLLRDSDAKRLLFPRFYTVTRLLPFGDAYVPTGACAVLNVKSVPEAMGIAQLLKVPPLRIDTTA